MRTLLKYFRWLFRHSEGVRWSLFWNIFLGIFNVAVSLTYIYLCKRLVDIATGDAAGNIIWYTVAVLVLIGVRLAVTAVNVRIENLASSRMNFIIRRRLYSELLLSRWNGKDSRHSGDTLNRLETDVNTVTSVICTDFPQIITTLVQLVAAVIFLCTLDWRLAVILLLITPFFLAFSKLFFRKMRTLTRNIRETESKVQSHLQESLQHTVVVRSMEAGEMMEERLDDLQNTEYGQVVARTRFNIFARTTVGAAFSYGYIAAFLWGVYGIYRKISTFGTMTAFLQIVGQIQRPVVNLTRQIPAFIYATASIDRLMELESGPKEETGEQQMVTGPAGIRISGLTFRYDDGDRDVLHGLDFDFPPSSRTAIVGETGIGKSTLVRLMLSVLKPTKGDIEIYGNGAYFAASPMTRCNIVYVPQGNTLFSGTIRENLRLGDPDATEDRMRWALETAEAGFVFDLPDGLDTICGEKGAGLSEGQAQRIAIARGLLRPGSILLMDEFSSSLDPETEARLVTNLYGSTAGKTLIFITHREQVVSRCDRVLNLEEMG